MRLAFSLLLLAATLACSPPGPPTALDATTLTPGMPISPTGPTAIGMFTRTGYPVTGSASVTVAGRVARLELSLDFSIGSAPGPVLYLNTTNNPNSGQPLRIGPLQRLNGAQTYDFLIPEGVRYTWVIIWCDPFNVGMAQASISPTP